jgi:hypothetical protein
VIRIATFITFVAIASAGLALGILLRPGDAALAVDVYLLFVGGLSLLVVIGRTLGRLPREARNRLDLPPAGPPAPTRPRELVRLERSIGMSTETAFDAHFRLRPALQNVAAAVLGGKGVDMHSQPSRAEELLGADLWEIVRPDIKRPRAHDAAGIPFERIAAAVDRLEAV